VIVTEKVSARAISWAEFANELPAYLATVRPSGAPRVHPVTPIFTSSGLFLFMEPTSPKRKDLLHNGLFALHSGVPDNAGTGGEFSCSGQGVPVDDPVIWARVAEASGYEPPERYIVFEFQLDEARCHGYGDVPIPAIQRWSAD
jgi:hypothetical protein